MERLELEILNACYPGTDWENEYVQEENSFEKTFEWEKCDYSETKAMMSESLKDVPKGRSNDIYYFV